MQRHRITVAYDGTSYAGWQIQPNGMTVQETLETALYRLSGERTKIHGSGRTDQGVHARAQVAHFDLSRQMDQRVLTNGLNAYLPSDIRILASKHVRQDFHARRSVRSKEYRYFMWCGDIMLPFLSRYRTHVRNPLDISSMREAAGHLIGRHDFAAFSANPNREIDSTVRNLLDLQISRHGSDVWISARADGFLYRMVRSIAGFLIRVGEGNIPPAETEEILASGRRTARVPTAPPQGLFLWKVTY